MVEAVWETLGKKSPHTTQKGRGKEDILIGDICRVKPTSDGVRPARLGGPASWRAV
jgi:hypothetical protein